MVHRGSQREWFPNNMLTSSLATKMQEPLFASRRHILNVINQTSRRGPYMRCVPSSRSAGQHNRFFRSAPIPSEEKRSFRGQLYESTAQRLARERAEEARFIDNRQKMGPSKVVRTFAITIRMSDVYKRALSWVLIDSSLLRRLRHGLLLRFHPTKRAT